VPIKRILVEMTLLWAAQQRSPARLKLEIRAVPAIPPMSKAKFVLIARQTIACLLHLSGPSGVLLSGIVSRNVKAQRFSGIWTLRANCFHCANHSRSCIC